MASFYLACHDIQITQFKDGVTWRGKFDEMKCTHIQCRLSLTSLSFHALFCFGSIHTLFTAGKGCGSTKQKKGIGQQRRHWRSTLYVKVTKIKKHSRTALEVNQALLKWHASPKKLIMAAKIHGQMYLFSHTYTELWKEAKFSFYELPKMLSNARPLVESSIRVCGCFDDLSRDHPQFTLACFYLFLTNLLVPCFCWQT